MLFELAKEPGQFELSSLLSDLPIEIEPAVPTFEPRPQGVRTALLQFVNKTSSKLIFKASFKRVWTLDLFISFS